MKPTLVTGATGFVGWHVARRLLERGERVRALARDPARLRDLDGVEAIRGDLRDRESLARAVQGCGVVYHVAADYRLWTREPAEMYRSNVDGTRHLLDAARNSGVEKVVYTSTVGCIGIPKDGIGDEQTPVGIEEMQGPYKRSKFLAEKVALEFAESGFPVVIVNPTAPVGDHDFKPTPTGKMLVDFVRGAMPAFLDTGLNVVDVRDVADGHLAAADRGRVGERYILGAENMTLQGIFGTLAQAIGRPAPKIKIPYALAYGVGVISTAWAGVSGKEPLAPLDGVKMARKKMWVRQDKAVRELGFAPGAAAGALNRAVEWFRANGYCYVRTWLVVAAEAREFSGILKRFGAPVKLDWDGAQFAREVQKDGDRWYLVANGPGQRCVSEVLSRKMDVNGIINTGFCGALDPALRIGDIVVWGDAPSKGGFVRGEIHSSDRVIVTAEEKRELREKTGAVAAEMEAGAVKKIAREWSVPFYCVRAVSDTANEDMPLDFNLYRDGAGRFSLPKIALAAMSRPFTRIPALRRLEANCNVASESLGAFFADCRF